MASALHVLSPLVMLNMDTVSVSGAEKRLCMSHDATVCIVVSWWPVTSLQKLPYAGQSL